VCVCVCVCIRARVYCTSKCTVLVCSLYLFCSVYRPSTLKLELWQFDSLLVEDTMYNIHRTVS